MHEIRDPDLARRHLLHGLLLSRAAPLHATRVADCLRWALEMAAEGWPLPPLGFVADLGTVMTSSTSGFDTTQLPDVEGLEHTLTRRYEDYVLGKLYGDVSFQRAADAVLQYSGRDRDRTVAYAASRLVERHRLESTRLAPAVIKRMLQQSADEILSNAWTLVDQEGVSKEVVSQTEALIASVRNAGTLLGPEDVFELESGTALAEFGQRVALRQVLHTAESLQRELPPHRPRNSQRRYSVASNVQQEDEYPIGGFTSLSNRGTFESLVRSELAYIEPGERPDLFDIKYARNELMYYSRDENQFLRRRMSFVFVLMPDLVAARIKDRELPVQRIVILLSCLYLAVRQLTHWLHEDSLHFEFLWIRESDNEVLQKEQQLIETLLLEPIALGNVVSQSIEIDRWQDRVEELARTTYCQTLIASTQEFSESNLPPNTTVARINAGDWQWWQDQLREWLREWCV